MANEAGRTGGEAGKAHRAGLDFCVKLSVAYPCLKSNNEFGHKIFPGITVLSMLSGGSSPGISGIAKGVQGGTWDRGTSAPSAGSRWACSVAETVNIATHGLLLQGLGVMGVWRDWSVGLGGSRRGKAAAQRRLVPSFFIFLESPGRVPERT